MNRDVACYQRAISTEVEMGAEVGVGTKVWGWSSIRKTARIGSNCVIGQWCDIAGVVGNGCHVQNGVYVYDGVILEDEVFVGPGVAFTNVREPDTERISHGRKAAFIRTVVERGAMIGANATIIAGARIGRGARIGAGSVVTVQHVPPGETWVGNPARKWAREEEGFIVSADHERREITIEHDRYILRMGMREFAQALQLSAEERRYLLEP